MNPRSNSIILLFASLFACVASISHAETADGDKPLHLVSDSMILDDAKQTSTFEGHVELTQGTLRIVAERVVVMEDKQGYQHLTATGSPASFRQKMEGTEEFAEGFGERIEYDTRTDTVDFFKRASVKRGQNEVMGDSITYNSKTEVFQARGKVLATGDKLGNKDRVRAVIQPKNDRPNKQDGVSIQPIPTLTTPTTGTTQP
jgi:lipopolysaccharide export system protein LptA